MAPNDRFLAVLKIISPKVPLTATRIVETSDLPDILNLAPSSRHPLTQREDYTTQSQHNGRYIIG